MSSGEKIPHDKAVEAAKRFRGLIIESCQNHCCAGSLRRKRPEVGDIEHVVISRTSRYIPDGSMFETEGPDILRRLDELVAQGVIAKQVKSNGQTRWGDRARACVHEGVVHEVYIATQDNWGAILAIRTGPAELSQEAVTRIKLRGTLQQKDGYLVYQKGGDRYPCPTEEVFFAAAGMVCLPPDQRQTPDTGERSE